MANRNVSMNALRFKLGALLSATALLALPLSAEDNAPKPADSPQDKPAAEVPAEAPAPLPPADFQSELDLHSMVPVEPLPELPAPPAADMPDTPPTRSVTVPSRMPVIEPPVGKTEQGIAHDPPTEAKSNMPVIDVEVPPADLPAPVPATDTPGDRAETKSKTH